MELPTQEGIEVSKIDAKLLPSGSILVSFLVYITGNHTD